MYRIYANAVPFFMRLEHPFIWVFTEFLILVPLGYWRMTAYRQIKNLSSIYIEIYLCHIWEREKDRDKEKQRDNWEQYLYLFLFLFLSLIFGWKCASKNSDSNDIIKQRAWWCCAKKVYLWWKVNKGVKEIRSRRAKYRALVKREK